MRHFSSPYVTDEAEALPHSIPGNPGTLRVTIDRSVGCQNLAQRMFRYGTGDSAEVMNEVSEEVFYVIGGRGRAVIEGKPHLLTERTALFVPPGQSYFIENPGHHELELLSTLSPQPGQPPGEQTNANLRADGKLTVSEDEEDAIAAGGDRSFKLLIDQRYGCRNLTQFVGRIQPGRAPAHTHTYEEVIYILDGEGVVHVGEGDYPIRTGSCIYLPPGSPHCLENTGATPLRPLGVFCPAGSPGSKQDAE